MEPPQGQPSGASSRRPARPRRTISLQRGETVSEGPSARPQRPGAGELLFSPDAIEVLRVDVVDIEELFLALGLFIPIRTNENLDLAGSRIKHAFIHEPESSAWTDVVDRTANTRPRWSVGG